MTLRPTFLVVLAITQFAIAQDREPRVDKKVYSPMVYEDHTVRFRYYAPNAQSVFLEMEGSKRTPLVKDDKGVWSFLTQSLASDYYVYSFIVDNQQLADPANELQKTIVTGGNESILYVPGSKDLMWEVNDVPHGIVHHHTIHSNVMDDGTTSFFVYTPPDYRPGTRKKYPVLILLHGVMDDESTWLSIGKANVILDNLIARKLAKSMIVVTPSGYPFQDIPDNVGELFDFRTDQQKLMMRYGGFFGPELIPELARNYRIDKKKVAIAGVSMGGAQALYLGLTGSETFSAIGAFSPAVIMFGKYERFFDNLGQVKLIEITCGTDDFLYKPVGAYREWLKAQKIDFTPIDTPGAHNWLVWRRNLIEFAPKLFR